ncbi:MAG: SMI1/KNR4 family protein [Psychromonas sp.]|nr:SMI1/KNR4 family protein [Alteromonadales bacterium]MCP5076641.1 SMI1/KNR4 family protein [Psychromonas sp.]
MNNIDLFVKNWGSKSTMVPISNNDLTELESQLNAVLPDSYKYLLSTYGLVHTPNVLTKICDLNSDTSEVQDFLSLDDVHSLSQLYEMTGMPKGHILFASDCNGDMFCFKQSDCITQQADVAVWFFNRNLGSITQLSDSFIGWLERFNTL